MDERARRRARRSLFDFALYLAPPGYQFGWHHALLYRHLDDFAQGRRKRLIVQMPPGHGKSEGASRNLPAYLFGQNPDARIIACSYTMDLAAEMSRDVQLIMDRPEYAAVFPKTRIAGPGVRTGFMGARRTAEIFDVVGRRGRYKCAGVGGGIAGWRLDFGIIDDPVKDRQAANSPVQREALWRWFAGVFSTRQAKDAGIVLVTTRWHTDDLAGRLIARMESGEGEPWDVLSLPAPAEGDLHPDDPREEGEPLWPWFKDREALDKQKALDPFDFAALYQQKPRNEGNVEWPEEFFTGPGFWFDDWPAWLPLKVMALDPSMGVDGKAGDYQALILYGRDQHGAEYVEADLAKRPPVAARAPDGTALTDGMVEHAVREYDRFGPECLALEVNQFQQLLSVPIRHEAARRGVPVRIVGVDNRVNKEVRIRRLGDPLGQRKLRFKRNSPGTRLLVQQLKEFPTGDKDDGADALEVARRVGIDLHNNRRTVRPRGWRA